MNLLDLMSAEYRKSRRALYASFVFSSLLYVAVLGDTMLRHEFSEAFAIFAFALQAGALLTRQFSSRRYESAEEIRRIAVLKDGLGIEPSELRKAEIVSRVGNVKAPKRIFVGKYFASEKAPGVSRFLEDMAESAFWTDKIAFATAWTISVLVLLGAAISVISLVGIVSAGLPTDKLKVAAAAAVVTLGFVVTGELLALSLQYFALSKRACQEMTAAATLQTAAPDRDAAILLFGEYNCALAGAPPLPALIHRILQKKLDSAWAARKAALPVQ